MCLAAVVDLYSRRMVGWYLGRCMEKALVSLALTMAINLRNPSEGLLFHSDRGSQYASHAYQALFRQHGMICSMSRKGNCWDNAPTERFFSSLKREWLTGMSTRQERMLWRMCELISGITTPAARMRRWVIWHPSNLNNMLSWVSGWA